MKSREQGAGPGRGFRRSAVLVAWWSLVFTYYYSVQGVPLHLSPPPQDGADGGHFESPSLTTEKIYELAGVNCTPPGIDDFPPDIFSPEERKRGWVIVHFAVSLYIFVALAVVCDDFFVPAMERICEELSLPSDVAGATFMAIATSAPELFTNLYATFITAGDIGVGTIVGSAVFNILAVAAVCGIGAGMVVPLEWWSVTRDYLCYLVSVFLLLIVLYDERVYWYEALILVLVYLLYILVMYKNSYLKKRAERLVFKKQRRISVAAQQAQDKDKETQKVETTYIPQTSSSLGEAGVGGGKRGSAVVDAAEDAEFDEDAPPTLPPPFKMTEEEREAEEEEGEAGLCDFPLGEGFKGWALFLICFPCKVLFFITVPDCRKKMWRKWYPLTFAMCILWIGTLSYIVNWMMTIIGSTLAVPDSVMGLTFIAAGTSVPEVVSSLIVARQGLGTMAVSNSIGSNTFDVLMCLGIPWLIKASMLMDDPVEPYIQIYSYGFQYSTLMLITSLALLYLIIARNRFVLDKKVGYLSLLLYLLFLLFASLLELNVFFTVNNPTCRKLENLD